LEAAQSVGVVADERAEERVEAEWWRRCDCAERTVVSLLWYREENKSIEALS